MDFFKAVEMRYSYRGEFLEEKLTEEQIRKILEAGIAAPTGMHITTTYYVAVTDADIIKALGECVPNTGMKTAPFVLVVLSEKKEEFGFNFVVENYAAAVQNILLAVTALGLATVWTDGVLRSKRVNDGVRRILNIPEHKKIHAVLPIGKAMQEPTISKKEAIENVVVWNGYE